MNSSSACLPVVLVPGIGGSELRIDGQHVWLRYSQLWGDLERLPLPGATAEAFAVLEGPMALDPFDVSFYRPWIGLLRDEFGYDDRNLFPFPYDWRQDCRESAAALRDFLGATTRYLGQKVAIIAHSMGGLVARYCVQVLDGYQYVDKLITIGTPHRGSLDSLLALMSGEEVFPPNWATKRIFAQRCRTALRTFPSMYQLLADPAEVYEADGSRMPQSLWDASGEWCTWGGLAHVSAACDFRRELAAASVTVPIFSIYGFDQTTLSSLRLRQRPDPWTRGSWTRRPIGDKRVTRDSARFDSTLSYPSATSHGRLPRTKAATEMLRVFLCERTAPAPEPPRPQPRLELDLGEGLVPPSTSTPLFASLISQNDVVMTGMPLVLEFEDGDGHQFREPIEMGRSFSTDDRGRYWAEIRSPETPGGYVVRLRAAETANLPVMEPVEDYLGVVPPIQG